MLHAYWCDELSCLHFDLVKNAAFCFVCMTFNKSNRLNRFSGNIEKGFIEIKFRNWKECRDAFEIQEGSGYHGDFVQLFKDKETSKDVYNEPPAGL